MAESDVSLGRLNPDSGERFQTLRRELGVQSFGINLIILEPGQRGRIHAHREQEEVYLVLEGELTLGIEGEEQTLGKDWADGGEGSPPQEVPLPDDLPS